MKNTGIFSPEFEKKMDTIFDMYEQQNASNPEISSGKKGKLTGKDILEMCPGLKEAMDEVLEKVRSPSDK